MATQEQLEELFKAPSSSGIRKLLSKNVWATLSPLDRIIRSSEKVTVVFYPSRKGNFYFEVAIYPDRTFESYQAGTIPDEETILRGEEFTKALELTRRIPESYYFAHLTLSLTNEDDSYTQINQNTLGVSFKADSEDDSLVLRVIFYSDKTFKIIYQDSEPLGTPAKMAAVKRCLDLIQKFEMSPRET